MQHHIWLTSNAKSLLTFIPGWPKMNFLVVSIVYYSASRRLYQLTLFLRGMILPNDRSASIRNLVGMCLAIGCCFGLAVALSTVELLDLLSVGLCSIGVGVSLVVLVTTTTSSTQSDGSVTSGSTPLLRLGSPILGCLAVFAFGTVWHHMAATGAGKIIPLQDTCENAVQRGVWVPANGCNEGSRGTSYRNYGVASLGTCDVYTWGWKADSSLGHCRFARREPKALLKLLRNRNVTFVGDSVLRHLYHAACRQLGDTAAGAYNTTMQKWSDFSHTYGSTAMEFRWAPFVSDLSEIVDRILVQDMKPDLLVIGGGAWDRLHKYNTSEEKTTLQDIVATLARQLDQLTEEISTTWVVPTTINTWGLMTPEKRLNIREDQMKLFREMYDDKGVTSSVSFVLDGTSFTVDRVQESYDGVHYPLAVYDGGAQILANAMDWLVDTGGVSVDDEFIPPTPGSMDNPWLGMGMLFFVFLGILLFDGFLGVSYVAALVVPQASPRRLYFEAFSLLHQRANLPSISSAVSLQELTSLRRKKTSERDLSSSSHRDDEVESLLSTSE